MSYREFAQWQAFDSQHPIGDDRADMGPALMCKTLAAVHGQDVALANFLPFQHRPAVSNDAERAVLEWANKKGKTGR